MSTQQINSPVMPDLQALTGLSTTGYSFWWNSSFTIPSFGLPRSLAHQSGLAHMQTVTSTPIFKTPSPVTIMGPGQGRGYRLMLGMIVTESGLSFTPGLEQQITQLMENLSIKSQTEPGSISPISIWITRVSIFLYGTKCTIDFPHQFILLLLTLTLTSQEASTAQQAQL